jgi:excisionase family DNA binding protein
METNKQILYPEDIASESGLGLNLVYRLLRSGQIVHVKAGDRYLISRVNFEKWVNGANAVSLKNNTDSTDAPDSKRLQN